MSTSSRLLLSDGRRSVDGGTAHICCIVGAGLSASQGTGDYCGYRTGLPSAAARLGAVNRAVLGSRD